MAALESADQEPGVAALSAGRLQATPQRPAVLFAQPTSDPYAYKLSMEKALLSDRRAGLLVVATLLNDGTKCSSICLNALSY